MWETLYQLVESFSLGERIAISLFSLEHPIPQLVDMLTSCCMWDVPYRDSSPNDAIWILCSLPADTSSAFPRVTTYNILKLHKINMHVLSHFLTVASTGRFAMSDIGELPPAVAACNAVVVCWTSPPAPIQPTNAVVASLMRSRTRAICER